MSTNKEFSLTQEELKSLSEYNPDTGVFQARQQRGTIRVGDIMGSVQVNGYRAASINSRKFYEHRLAWLYTYGYFPSGEQPFIDHVDGDRTNNRISNLRLCSNINNTQNIKMKPTNTSGFKGVTWHKKAKKWMVCIRNGELGKVEYLGLFVSEEEASVAYENRAKEIHGEFYRDTRKETNE
jgi:hypothetical protein